MPTKESVERRTKRRQPNTYPNCIHSLLYHSFYLRFHVVDESVAVNRAHLWLLQQVVLKQTNKQTHTHTRSQSAMQVIYTCRLRLMPISRTSRNTHFRDIYFAPVQFCDQRVSMFVCLFVCLLVCLSARISQKPHVPISPNFLHNTTRGRGSVLL